MQRLMYFLLQVKTPDYYERIVSEISFFLRLSSDPQTQICFFL